MLLRSSLVLMRADIRLICWRLCSRLASRSSSERFRCRTNAHPEEMRSSNSRIVGKRFKIVHVKFGREIVEVTTFRAPHSDHYDETHSESGMTLIDNNFGSFSEDVFRRDFTINAIYYQPNNRELIDLANGAMDVMSRTIRTIGNPESRFREDPVRMMRAARFEAKLEFELDPETREQIHALGYLIRTFHQPDYSKKY